MFILTDAWSDKKSWFLKSAYGLGASITKYVVLVASKTIYHIDDKGGGQKLPILRRHSLWTAPYVNAYYVANIDKLLMQTYYVSRYVILFFQMIVIDISNKISNSKE